MQLSNKLTGTLYHRLSQAFSLALACLLAVLPAVAVGVRITRADAAESVIVAYRTNDPATQVQVWKKYLTRPSGNPRFAEFQEQRLNEWNASEFAPYRLNNPALVAQVRQVLLPVLRLYRRQDCFEIIVIKHPVPIMMNDSGVLLMVSTGLIERATSDDELLGHIAHELGHDLLWRETASARETLARYKERGDLDPRATREAREALGRVELECDAFSAVTLAAIGRNPLYFGEYLKAIEHDFPDYLNPALPACVVRASVIRSVVPVAACRVAPQTTPAFKALKRALSGV